MDVHLIIVLALSTRLVLGITESESRRSAFSTDGKARCKSICKDYFEFELDKTFCRPALDWIPRPSIYQSCVMGRVAAFEHICMPTCMGYNSTAATYDSHAVCKSEEKKQNPMAHVTWCRKAYDTTIPEISHIIAARSPFPKSIAKVSTATTTEMTTAKHKYNSTAEGIQEDESTDRASGNHSFVPDFSNRSSDLTTNIVAGDLSAQTATGSNDHHDEKNEYNSAAKIDETTTNDVSGHSDACGESLVINSNLSSNLVQSEEHADAAAASITLHQDSLVSYDTSALFQIDEKRKADHDVTRATEALDEDETSDDHSFVYDLGISNDKLQNTLVQTSVSEKSNDTILGFDMHRNITIGRNDHHDDSVEFTFKDTVKSTEGPTYAVSAQSDALGSESLVVSTSLSSNLGQSEEYDGAVATARALHHDAINSLTNETNNLFDFQEETTIKQASNEIVEKQVWDNITISEQLASSVNDEEL